MYVPIMPHYFILLSYSTSLPKFPLPQLSQVFPTSHTSPFFTRSIPWPCHLRIEQASRDFKQTNKHSIICFSKTKYIPRHHSSYNLTETKAEITGSFSIYYGFLIRDLKTLKCVIKRVPQSSLGFFLFHRLPCPTLM